jgi:DNA-binding MarR family transcriptional regulator
VTDKRRTLLQLTSLGERELAAGRPAWLRVQETVTDEVGEGDVADLLVRLRGVL